MQVWALLAVIALIGGQPEGAQPLGTSSRPRAQVSVPASSSDSQVPSQGWSWVGHMHLPSTQVVRARRQVEGGIGSAAGVGGLAGVAGVTIGVAGVGSSSLTGAVTPASFSATDALG